MTFEEIKEQYHLIDFRGDNMFLYFDKDLPCAVYRSDNNLLFNVRNSLQLETEKYLALFKDGEELKIKLNDLMKEYQIFLKQKKELELYKKLNRMEEDFK